mmetsp:Transcript_33375/g.88603  ORF Transcript_33375/g.88603 Transcript_33375/m.88603 type:complete len:296 (-) Transcript_33375:294-1181(-)
MKNGINVLFVLFILNPELLCCAYPSSNLLFQLPSVGKLWGKRLFNIAMTSAPLKAFVIPAETVPDSVIIFLHGSGDTGGGIGSALKAYGFKLPSTKIICPTAPLRKYSLYGEHGLSNVWFDRKGLHPSAKEDVEGMAATTHSLRTLIDAEVASTGVPLSRMFLGGFSMGGGMSLRAGLADPLLSKELAGVFALSSFLAEESVVVPAVAAATATASASSAAPGRVPPVLMCHGEDDDLIPIDWASETADRLRAAGLGGGGGGGSAGLEWREFSGLGHEVRPDELAFVREWVRARLV